jgi:DNA-binding GntR family transcriptional regulator
MDNLAEENRKRGRPRIEAKLDGRKKKLIQPALHEKAVDTLRDLIVRGELKAGERIAENAVCEAFGISRTPLREALKLLAAEGLVELRPNRGATITPLRMPEMTSLFEVMSGIERFAAELAATRLSKAEIKRLHTLQARMESCFEAGDRDDYFRINQDIHRLIVAGAKNEVLTSTHAWLLARAERARYLALHTRTRWAESVAEHRAILTALEEGNVALAGRLLGDHVAHTSETVITTLVHLEADTAQASEQE